MKEFNGAHAHTHTQTFGWKMKNETFLALGAFSLLIFKLKKNTNNSDEIAGNQ